MFQGGGGGRRLSRAPVRVAEVPWAACAEPSTLATMIRWAEIYDAKVIRRMPKFMGWVKGPIIIGALGTLIRTGMTLAMPMLVAKATNDYMVHKNVNGLTVISLIYVAIFAGHVGWALISRRLNLTYAGQGIILPSAHPDVRTPSGPVDELLRPQQSGQADVPRPE